MGPLKLNQDSGAVLEGTELNDGGGSMMITGVDAD